ncbi:hypothetical protein [Ferruginibacter sp. SUN106]|uniref:hypothetical protein n=1 Tax=Ferruginibacter sp. SUN106 TaxID=2978348 RepID=UPI003D365C47
MELEEMQTLWNELSAKVDKQNTLTDQLIVTMTKERYKNRFQKIKHYEIIASFVAAIMAILVLINLGRLNTWYLLACGIFTAAHLLLLPPLVLSSLNRIKNISISNKNYKETLLAFAKAKQWLLFVQRLSVFLNFFLMLAVVPVAIKLIDNKDIFEMNNPNWFWIVPAIVLIFVVLSVWGYRWYQCNARNAELLLGELDN